MTVFGYDRALFLIVVDMYKQIVGGCWNTYSLYTVYANIYEFFVA